MNQNPSYQYNTGPGTPSYRQTSDMGYSPMMQDSTNSTGDEVKFLKKKYKKSQNKVFHDFFKTKVCQMYNLNICTKGESCPFAHSPDELREKPNLAKTKLCEAYLETGFCKNGDQCSFAHGEDELRSTPDLFKTAICNLWNQGKCNSGDRCRFAHGVEDLRPAPMHYKSKKGPSPGTSKGPSSYRQSAPKVQMPMVQQSMVQQPTLYTPQFTPMVMDNNTFPQYQYTPMYQEMPPQFFGIPLPFTNQMGMGMGKGPVQGKSPF
mmetsp:Transcript_33831/g.39337  ORF Transcript_33831/g.39337 Transcript_33831/m.39337 type:complete len:263 (-) Transcript_33831:289-1077(-)